MSEPVLVLAQGRGAVDGEGEGRTHATGTEGRSKQTLKTQARAHLAQESRKGQFPLSWVEGWGESGNIPGPQGGHTQRREG